MVEQGAKLGKKGQDPRLRGRSSRQGSVSTGGCRLREETEVQVQLCGLTRPGCKTSTW